MHIASRARFSGLPVICSSFAKASTSRNIGLKIDHFQRVYLQNTTSKTGEGFRRVSILGLSAEGVDWDDRIQLQSKWSNEEKGWKVAVQWKETPYGVGLFSAQHINAGTILRKGCFGRNLLRFETANDIEAFLQDVTNSAESQARLRYVSDYLWGFYAHSDERGYPISLCTDRNNQFVGMWIPGNGLNHDVNPNTVYRPKVGGLEEGIDLIALTDIAAGDELFDDYRRHGSATTWLLEFAKTKNINLNFEGCNDFVRRSRET
jgi:hypothetical protein